MTFLPPKDQSGSLRGALIEASPLLLGMGQQLSGRNPAGIATGAALMQEKAESAKRKAAIDGLMGSMGLSGPQRAILESLPVDQSTPLIWQHIERQNEIARQREQAEASNLAFAGYMTPGGMASPEFVNAVMMAESAGNPNAVSPKGAVGTMQTMPGTLTDPGFGVTPARDNSAAEKHRVGVDYLNAMLQRYNGDQARALVAYNWGPANADKWDGSLNSLPAETRNYVKKILKPKGISADAVARAIADPRLSDAQKEAIKFKYEQSQPKERKIIKAADGFNYYQDTGERVLPSVQSPQSLTDDMKEYNFALDRGDTDMTFTEWMAKKNVALGGGDLSEAEKLNPSSTGGMIDSVNAILDDPALDNATGMLEWTQAIPGTPMYRFGTRVKQLQGQAFLQAFEGLKGGGQITEVEGRKATEAIGRLDSGQSAEDYREALTELRDILIRAMQRPRGWADTSAGKISVMSARDIGELNLQDLSAEELEAARQRLMEIRRQGQ